MGYSQILLKLEYEKLNYAGHSVTMYYSCNSLKELKDIIFNSKNYKNENNVLNSFGIPITDSPEGNCENEQEFLFMVKDMLSQNKNEEVKVIEEASLKKRISLSIIKSSYSLCMFEPTVNHWGSYHIDLKKYVIITSQPEVLKFNCEDLVILKKIKKKIKKKLGS